NPFKGYESSSSPASRITSSPTSILPLNFTTFSGEQYPSLLSALYISNLVPLIMMDSYTPVTVHTSPALNPCKVGSSVESNSTVSPTSILPFNFTTLSGEQNPILPSCFLTPNLVSFIGDSYICSTVHTSP